MRSIPNCISFSRIIFSLILIFVKPISVVFYVIYIICGFSDIMDGFIAMLIFIAGQTICLCVFVNALRNV